MVSYSKSPSAIAETLGERLKLARLNADLTQKEVADRAGLSRKVVLNAEKGKSQLEAFVAIMMVLNLEEQLDLFLPPPMLSPIQLVKLQGKQRQRASGQRKNKQHKKSNDKALMSW
jgi:transcriptional regulator with XRE-family HTH domain